MGMYMYRVTAKVVTLDDGRKAHVCKYAYKPYRTMSGEKENARAHFQTGCYASEKMTLKTDLVVTLDANDSRGRVYHNPRGFKTFLDDCTFGTEHMPFLGHAIREGNVIHFVPKEGQEQ